MALAPRMAVETELTQFGHAYLTFLNHAGQVTDPSKLQGYGLFSKNFTKRVNGTQRVAQGESLSQYLLSAQNTYGQWRISALRVLPSFSSQAVTIQYTVEAARVRMLVLAILTLGKDGLIYYVDEVDTTL